MAISFGVSIIMGLTYLILYRTFSPITDFILFIIIASFVGFSYIKANDSENHYIKISLIFLIACIVLIPKLFFFPDSSLLYKSIWTVITLVLLKTEISKEIQAIKES